MKNKRIAIINSYNCGSTGKISCKIGDFATEDGYEVLLCFPKHTINISNVKDNQFLFGKQKLFLLNAYLTELTGLFGYFQFYNTTKLIKRLNNFKPDLISLHNIHSSYVNIGMLFKYIKKNKIPVVWTLHDCWAFTGRCAYFTLSCCGKWKNGCYKCKFHDKNYPKAFFDASKLLWKRKKYLFNSIDNLVLITPSVWLNDLVKQSFLKEKNNMIIRNGIDLDVYRPSLSNFRSSYNISDNAFIILGVAFDWNYKKGLDVFVELSKLLPSNYQIVLVGTNDYIDRELPSNIISIHRTHNSNELAEIYTAADIFINPTREEMLGMTNIEANACGTPVITFNTGGSPECISDKSGSVFFGDSVSEFADFIIQYISNSKNTSNECIENAKHFDDKTIYREYIELFNEIIGTD